MSRAGLLLLFTATLAYLFSGRCLTTAIVYKASSVIDNLKK
jgi:hypothetical protein